MLGFIGLFAALLPLAGIPLAGVGLALGLRARRGPERGTAWFGIALCTLDLLIAGVVLGLSLWLVRSGRLALQPLP